MTLHLSETRRNRAAKWWRRLRAEPLESRLLLATDFGGIQGNVFNDLDGDGTFDAGEPGLSGVTVQLTQGASVVGTDLTDASGVYQFTGLTAGTYQVEQVPPPPAGFTQLLGGQQTVTITAADAMGTVTTVIDTFDDTTQMVEASLVAGPMDGTTIPPAAEALGGERDLFVRLTSATGEITLAANANLPDVLDLGTLFNSTGEARVTWDGFDGDAEIVATNGLAGADRVLNSNGGTHFQLRAGAELVGGDAILRIYTGAAGTSSQSTFLIPATAVGTTQEILIPFTSFAAANLGDVGAVELVLDPQNTADGAVDSIGVLGPTFVTQNFPNSNMLDLVLTKSVDNGTPSLRGTVTFTVTVTNNGPADATNVSVSDSLPAGMTLVTATPSAGTSYNATSGVWTVGNLANGNSATLTLTGSVDSLGTKINNASITGVDQTESNLANNAATAMVTPTAIDLSLTKVASETMPNVGGAVSFTIQVTNNAVTGSPATTATNVSILDQLPNGFTFTSSPASQGSYNATTGIWTVGSLAVGSTATLTINGAVATTNQITNTAQVSAADQIDVDSTPGNSAAAEDDQASVVIMPARPAIGVSKLTNNQARDVATGGPTVRVGSTVTFTYLVTNEGTVPLANVRVQDDNGTAADTTDDFFATLVSGDTNSDTQLDLTETWTFRAQRTAAEGLLVNRATATGTGNGQPVQDQAVSNHTGIVIPEPLGKRRFLASSFRRFA